MCMEMRLCTHVIIVKVIFKQPSVNFKAENPKLTNLIELLKPILKIISQFERDNLGNIKNLKIDHEDMTKIPKDIA